MRQNNNDTAVRGWSRCMAVHQQSCKHELAFGAALTSSFQLGQKVPPYDRACCCLTQDHQSEWGTVWGLCTCLPSCSCLYSVWYPPSIPFLLLSTRDTWGVHCLLPVLQLDEVTAGTVPLHQVFAQLGEGRCRTKSSVHARVLQSAWIQQWCRPLSWF